MGHRHRAKVSSKQPAPNSWPQPHAHQLPLAGASKRPPKIRNLTWPREGSRTGEQEWEDSSPSVGTRHDSDSSDEEGILATEAASNNQQDTSNKRWDTNRDVWYFESGRRGCTLKCRDRQQAREGGRCERKAQKSARHW